MQKLIEKGFSLVEITVSMAILSSAVLAILQMNGNIFQASGKLQSQSAKIEIFNNLNQLLKNEWVCQDTFVGHPIGNLNAIPLSDPVISVGDKASGIEITQLKTSKEPQALLGTDDNGNTLSNIKFTVSFIKDGQTFQAEFFFLAYVENNMGVDFIRSCTGNEFEQRLCNTQGGTYVAPNNPPGFNGGCKFLYQSTNRTFNDILNSIETGINTSDLNNQVNLARKIDLAYQELLNAI